MSITFSFGLHDSDGDVYDDRIILWNNNQPMVAVNKGTGIQDLIAELQRIDDEIFNNY